MSLANSFYATGRVPTPSQAGKPKTPAARTVTKGATHTGPSAPAGGFLKITDGFRPGTGAPASTPQVGALPSPAPPPKPAAGPPIDPVYDAQVGAAQRTRNDTVAGLANARSRGLANYGYTASFDQAGTPTNLTFDPSNPFSQAALLKRSYDQQRSGNVNGYAAQGQLYSGALQNAAANTNFKQGAAEDGLQKALIDFLAGNASGVQTANNNYDTNVAGYASDRVARATGG